MSKLGEITILFNTAMVDENLGFDLKDINEKVLNI